MTSPASPISAKQIPREVSGVLQGLQDAGFEAFIVGGCVRDLLLGRTPEDWDVTTNARPEEIQKIFLQSFYENRFFTVTVQTGSEEEKLKEIEVTTYRADVNYRDRRRPEEVKYAETLEEDLSRRDFTMNAIALAQTSDGKEKIVDPFEGQKDLEKRLVCAVGMPAERFQEDALRMMRAARFATALDFEIEPATKLAIQEHAGLLGEISGERIRDELAKMIMAERAVEGIELLRELKLLRYIMPELEEGCGVGQNKHHKYDVWEHNLYSLKYAVQQQWSLQVRLASLLHDAGKPRVKQGEGQNCTFYNHEVVGANMARDILNRLKFPKKDAEKITRLIRYHMFYYNVDEVTESSVRRLIRNLGPEHIGDLLKVRMADRIGSGVPKAVPYKLRHWQYLIEKVSQDPISASMLKINGEDVMKVGQLQPSPTVGQVLSALLGEVLDDPKKNAKEYLESRAKELVVLSAEELEKLAAKGREEKEEVEQEREKETKEKYWVK
ncbi:MAG: hypothetical protein A2748_01980 [Candidatus Wildermuthbacteria bacterium RIFCSPHIGHO2_01_FULL_45_20]|uniref:HD domain-containing protein n=1 Tax=Candidatus Wildermuthbacteria bacterium RIFCSPHIGHO2_02_FULL_45_25 TaxID=1802450 RepID=A0A1G2R4K9_9BACT|nr:MAG: hypothetical protein A2748_01980 [Candidatus Wildermuthbacteria bacterium RIFCSPHIGHO2_01_FULL_45_20]OHA67182.1 MAG: hypothetical protein A3C04_02625 [Candidatus Wildermuthbacteria bacterium RIFCSPHIGHO2_02_FULL_45_25]